MMGEYRIRRKNRKLRFLIPRTTHAFLREWNSNLFTSNSSEIIVNASGYAFDGSKLLPNSKMLSKHISEHLSGVREDEMFTEFQEIVKQLNGSFALVVEASNSICAAVDRVRSIPLFYGVSRDQFILGNGAQEVREHVINDGYDDIALKEFLLTGYVTGPDTLCKGVKQLQAGECILAYNNGEPNIISERYYRFITHRDLLDQSVDQLYAAARDVLAHVFERLVKSVCNRQIVVPLSGGLDSRLIVAMLKTIGTKDVVCFSYGRTGNWESQISKRVAERVGYTWEFVPESSRKWRRWHQTDQCKAYYEYAHNLCSYVHLQDWAAVWELKKQGKISDGAVFVPGHTGDVIAGSHIPPFFGQVDKIGKDILINELFKRHYSRWNWLRCREQLGPILESRILSSVGDFSFDSPEDAASALECWEWQERQAKFIVNSVRVYEFWGYDWRLPFWDSQMLDFWTRMPLRQRVKKAFYNRFLNETLFQEMGIKSFPDVKVPLIQASTSLRDSSEKIALSRLLRYGPGKIWKLMTFRRLPDLGISSLRDSLKCKNLYKKHFGKKSYKNIYEIDINAHVNYHTFERVINEKI